MTRAEELWKEYSRREHTEIGKIDFLAALHEYGAEVRKRDAELCHFVGDDHNGYGCRNIINREPLP